MVQQSASARYPRYHKPSGSSVPLAPNDAAATMSDAEDDDEYEQPASEEEADGEQEADEMQQIDQEGEEDEEEGAPKQKGKKRKARCEEEEEEGEEGGGYKEEEYHGEKMSRFYVCFRAHCEYAVPQEFVAHEAPKYLKVKSGDEIAELVKYTGIKYWANLKWYHVTILAGQNLTTKERNAAPYVCMNVPGNEETDDPNWLRPIVPAVMKHFVPVWKKQIKEKCGDDKQAYKAMLKQYESVLQWDDTSPKLDPAKLGVGRGGFKQLRHKKLKSLRTPDAVKVGPGRGGKKQAVAGGKGKAGPSSEAGSSTDTACATWAVPDGKVLRLPGVATCFKSDSGSWFAVYTE